MKNVNKGLSYTTLKLELENKGYDFNNSCVELAVKQWFVDNFNHYPHRKENGNIESEIVYIDEINVNDIITLEKHLECNFILSGQACLTLLECKNVKHTLMCTIIAIIIAFIAIIQPLISHILDYVYKNYNYYF
jgi:hypothetical protein